MKATFLGDGDHDVCRVFDIDFPVGEAVEVTDPHAMSKLPGMGVFAVTDELPPEPEPDPEPAQVARPRKAA